MTGATPAGTSTSGTTRNRGRRRHRGLVALLVTVVVVLVLLAVADRIAERIADHKLAGKIQSAQQLTSRPDVSIGGFPFLTQVLHGHYHSVSITSTPPVTVNGVAVTDVRVHLQNVQVSTSDALHGTVRNVPVSAGTSTAVLRYAQVNTLIARYAGSTIGSAITVTPGAAGHARLVGPLGLSLDVTPQVRRGQLYLVADSKQLAALPVLVAGPIRQIVTTPIPLPAFPFGVHLTSATPEPDGIHLQPAGHRNQHRRELHPYRRARPSRRHAATQPAGAVTARPAAGQVLPAA